MEPKSPMQETVYGTNNEDSHVMSEKVQNLASNIYQELERMIERYDEDVVKELMPLVVSVLESLDSAVMDNQEHEVELELLREDNEQLVTQYEREKQLRRNTEQRLMEIEYSNEDDHRDLQSKVESLESIVRMLELKAKNACDHASRLEEKENDMKKEYSKLHERYTELFKTHMDYIERTKILFGTDRLDALNSKPRSLNFSHLKSEPHGYSANSPGSSSKPFVTPLDLASMVSPTQSSESNASLKSELQDAHVISPTSPVSGSKKRSKLMMEKGQLTDKVSQSDQSTGTKACWVEDFENNLNDMEVTSPEMDEVEELNNFNFDVENSSVRGEHRRQNTLYQELSFNDSDALGELDEGADITGGYVHPGDYASSDSESETDHEHKAADNFFGMGKEVENLISENNELLATKNALNIVKDDLIARVDELTSEQEILREELKSYISVKEKLKQRVNELEEELKKVKESAKGKSNKSDDEEDVPMAQRKRFTRVEMARVLMERNQYKERLMELQEAVRWTEMIRASRSDSSLDTKRNRSSIWKFFSNLFNPNEKPVRKPLSYSNVPYTTPTSSSSPALDTMRRKRLGDRHRSLDFHDSEMASERLHQQRAKERREQYKQVRAHVRKDDGRLQAYGWSLPTKPAASSKASTETAQAAASVSSTTTATTKSSSAIPVPVPVYCRPLLEKEPAMKVWCAAGVNISGGKLDDKSQAVSVVGSSLFYVNNPDSVSEVDKLDKELQDNEMLRMEHENIEHSHSSTVWLCTSAHSKSNVIVIDANNPSEILDSFHVCSSHLLCITSIPGAKESDYPVDEPFLKMQSSHPLEKTDIANDDGSAEITKIGNIRVVANAVEVVEDSPEKSQDKPISLSDFAISDEEGDKHSNKSESINGTQDSSASETLALTHRLREAGESMSSVLPTMWLGSQAGNIYVHSSVAQWWRCIHSTKLRDSVLVIVHIRGRVFVGLADGTAAVFHRAQDGQWDLSTYHLIDLGQPQHSIRCMTVVNNNIWCGYRNCIRVLNSQSLAIVDSFDAHPRKESQVKQMAWSGDGVWISIRLDSTLRLYHAHTHRHLQDVDIEPYVSKMLGTGKLGFSFVRITALLISCGRLWMGTGNGVIISVPLAESTNKQNPLEVAGKAPGGMVRVYSDNKENISTSSYIPYCSMAQAQLSFHGHRDSVKFFVAVPGHHSTSEAQGSSEMPKPPAGDEKPTCMLVLSGGEGYIDFRMGDGEEEVLTTEVSEEDRKPLLGANKSDSSHLIVWQVSLPD